MLSALVGLLAAGHQLIFDPSGFVATLPSGTVVAVRAIANDAGDYWSPTGKPVARSEFEPFLDELNRLHHWNPRGFVAIFYDVRPRDPGADLGFSGDFVGKNKGNYGSESGTEYMSGDGPRHKGQVYVESSSQPEAGLDVRVSEGPFKLVARARRAGNSLRTVFGPEFRPRFVSSHMTWRDGDQTRELPTKRLECRSIVKHTYTQQPRFCAFDQRGKLLGEPFIDADEISFGAPNEPKASDVARIDLLVRPTVQIHFRRIHLKPNPA